MRTKKVWARQESCQVCQKNFGPHAGIMPRIKIRCIFWPVYTHYIIDRDGTIYGMVPTLYKVNHCVGMNHNSVAIDLMRGEGEEILDVQYESLNRLITYISSVYNIRIIELHKKGLFYHCDIRPTQCPRPIDDEKVWKWT